MLGNLITYVACGLVVLGIVLSIFKKWKAGLLLILLGLGWIFYISYMFVGKTYTYTTTYPAACWSDDGKQIIYLMHKEIGWQSVSWGGASTLQSKTYLMIMDANGKNKKVVGEVVHPRERENFDNAMKKYEEGKIFLTNFGKFESPEGNYSLRLNGSDIEITEYKNWRKIIWSKNYVQKKNYLFMPFWWRV